MAILDVLKKSVKVQIKAKEAVNAVIDEILEPALQKVVADSSNKFDDLMLASIYPGLEAEVKSMAGKKIDELVAKLPPILQGVIEIV
jgi:hypothetical protein